MARKLASADAVGKPRKRKTSADKSAEELQVLDPTADLHVGGEKVTVREYGFFQKSRVAAEGRAFVRDLAAIVGNEEVEDVFDEVRLLFGPHEAFVKYAIAESIGKPLAWVEALPDHDIEPLAYLWFGVAGRHFFSEVAVRARGRHLKEALDGSTFSTPSAETSNVSAAAPSVN